MSIVLQCTCGAQLRAKDSDAGRKGRCKKCGVTFVVPDSRNADDLSLGVAETTPASAAPPKFTACSECGEQMVEGTVVCIKCGYHTELKRQLDATNADQGSEAGMLVGGVAIALAVGFVVGSGFFQGSMDGPQFLVFYFVLFVLAGVVTLLLRMSFADTDLINYSAAIFMVGVGAVRVVASIQEGKFKLLFLAIGMFAAFVVFFLTCKDNSTDSPFATAEGNFHVWTYLFVLAAGLGILGAIYFVPPVSDMVASLGKFTLFAAIAGGLFSAGWIGRRFGLLQSVGHGGGMGYHSCSSCSSCSSCGGGGCGGCGGGCGGCGD